MARIRPLTGQVAVVTGAASGIGRSLAQLLDRKGCPLALCDVDEHGLKETASPSCSRTPLTQVVDVADREAMTSFAADVQDAHGRADLVINNAGVDLSQTVEAMTYEDFEWLMGINFWGVVHGTKEFLPGMLERRHGTIVNISSIFGIFAFPTHSAYSRRSSPVRGLHRVAAQRAARHRRVGRARPPRRHRHEHRSQLALLRRRPRRRRQGRRWPSSSPRSPAPHRTRRRPRSSRESRRAGRRSSSAVDAKGGGQARPCLTGPVLRGHPAGPHARQMTAAAAPAVDSVRDAIRPGRHDDRHHRAAPAAVPRHDRGHQGRLGLIIASVAPTSTQALPERALDHLRALGRDHERLRRRSAHAQPADRGARRAGRPGRRVPPVCAVPRRRRPALLATTTPTSGPRW